MKLTRIFVVLQTDERSSQLAPLHFTMYTCRIYSYVFVFPITAATHSAQSILPFIRNIFRLRWRQLGPLKSRYPTAALHGVTTQKKTRTWAP